MRQPRPSESIDVLVVGSPACGHCRDAKILLDDLRLRYPLDVRELDMTTEEGTAIVRRHGVPFPPAVLVDGEFFGYGRISRRKLERRLAGLVGEV